MDLLLPYPMEGKEHLTGMMDMQLESPALHVNDLNQFRLLPSLCTLLV